MHSHFSMLSNRHRHRFLFASILLAGATTTASAQNIDPNTGLPIPSAGDGAGAIYTLQGDMLACDGGWRFPLTEVRQEIGPARFARQRDLQRDLVIAAAAFGYCEAAEMNGFGGDAYTAVLGPCSGLLKVAEKIDSIASNLFRPEEADIAACLTTTPKSGGDCEGVRGQLTNLRTYDEIIVDRAELVLAYEVCSSPERGSNSMLRGACETLEGQIASELGSEDALPGLFSLSAPLPTPVALAVSAVAVLTDGRFLSVTPENFVGVRRSMCMFPEDAPASGMRVATILERSAFVPAKSTTMWAPKDGAVKWGMCNELALADVNAASCRAADVYIDERGELHLNSPLTTAKQRRNATLCVDVSDFHPDSPLMVTIGLDATGSVPERMWPGETMQIGELIDRKVTRDDVLNLHVFGKAHGVSLAEVLRVNNITDINQNQEEACRMARSWVPVVDHEVPIGDPDTQAVIPIEFGRGRVGETQRLEEGDAVMLWVKDIEPSGSVMIEYAAGQYVGYQPPPLLGEPEPPASPPDDGSAPLEPIGFDADGNPLYAKNPGYEPGSSIGMAMAAVDLPLLPRRARYPGSRVLRLGSPKGNYEFPLRVCTKIGSDTALINQGVGAAAVSGCASGGRVIVDERMFIHGESHFGVQLMFGYSAFPGLASYGARPIGGDGFEVIETAPYATDYDLAVLLAVYPGGRDPRAFRFAPWTLDYWKGTALLAGFGVKDLNPFDDFYGGLGFQIGNGVSLSVLAHVSRRDLLLGVRPGDTFTSSSNNPDVADQYTKAEGFATGVTVGVAFDYDLFERAFTNIISRFRGSHGTTFDASSSEATTSQPGYDGDY